MTFDKIFQGVTGNKPFPWQAALFERFAAGEFPASANIPTGLGKTSVVAVWLIALALHPENTPRRLVYVVNRRTVVDQTTAEVEKLRLALSNPELSAIAGKLRALCALPLPVPDAPLLAVSTLRGQFADNREWSADPARPAVIIGTVDMIGSGLLFSRYTVGFKLRPHHAALLGQDVLLIHDEAHLEPAFQVLLGEIELEQKKSADLRTLRVMELTATSRSESGGELPHSITETDHENEVVKKRVGAVKRLLLMALGEGEKLPEKLIAQAKEKTGDRSVLIFVRSVETAVKIAAELDKNEHKGKVATLTGTMRGKERDGLVVKNVFQRFLPKKDRAEGVAPVEGTVFLVATSAGEVGVNISADDLLCDLSTFESMAQRFGRVNRFGERDDSKIIVVHETEFDTDNKKTGTLETARERALALLQKLGDDASSAALDKLPASERAAAFSPPPQMRVATEIQFDAWALTSIRERIAARPPVAPYLHGEAEWQPPETHVAWREEVDIVRGELLSTYPPEDLLEDFPLKPHELLRDVTGRVTEVICELAAKSETTLNTWIISELGKVKIKPLSDFADTASAYAKPKTKRTPEEKRKIESLEADLADATLILPALLGGIKNGLLSSDAASDSADVSEMAGIRCRVQAAAPEIPEQYADFRLIRIIDTKMDAENDEEASDNRYWLWLEAKHTVDAEKRAAQQAETLAAHTAAVVANARAIAAKLLPAPNDGEPNLRRCLVAAARLHDIGKNRRQWQLGIGNIEYDAENPDSIFAKSGGNMRQRDLNENYRHEFGSLADMMKCQDFAALSDMEKEIALHLVAAHHGRARPHFPTEEIFDYAAAPDALVALAEEIPRRFARLQGRFGRWGLVWLESLLRAADYAASAGIAAKSSSSENEGI